MKNISNFSQKQSEQKRQKASIYWDLQNVFFNLERGTLLLNFVQSKYHLIHKKAYYSSLYIKETSIKQDLQSIGFQVVDVKCSVKNSADNQLKSDSIDDIYSYYPPDAIILLSGDGDFVNIAHFLQEKNKRVIVLAQKGNAKTKLVEIADEFYFVEDLPDVIKTELHNQTNHITSISNYTEELPNITENQVQHQDIADISSGIYFYEAVNYLITAIETANKQGKTTELSCVNQLMIELFPKYKGVASIRTLADKRQFTKFSLFVKAVIKEGKIRMSKKKLQLIK